MYSIIGLKLLIPDLTYSSIILIDVTTIHKNKKTKNMEYI